MRKEMIFLLNQSLLKLHEMDWTQEITLAFIDAYKMRELIWNPKHPFYFHKNLKNDAWEEIAREINRPLDECKKKMDTLLSSFRRENMKIRKYTNIAGARGYPGIYKSRWYAYERLKFLMEKRKAASQLHQQSMGNQGGTPQQSLQCITTLCDPQNIWNPECAAAVPDRYEEDNLPVDSSEQKKEGEGSGQIRVSLLPKEHIKTPNEVKKVFKCKSGDVYTIENDLDANSNTVDWQKQTDEYSLYGEQIACKLRKMDPITRLETQHQINGILFEVELNILKNTSQQPQSLSPEQYMVSSPSNSPEFTTIKIEQDNDFSS